MEEVHDQYNTKWKYMYQQQVIAIDAADSCSGVENC